MEDMYSRTRMLIGEDNLENLRNSHVAVFGVGGVGGCCTEALARAGVGTITIVDKDSVSVSNINRQIIATRETVGRNKTEVMAERIAAIDPSVKVIEKCIFFLPETADEFDFNDYDYVVDAVDTVTAKLELICRAKECDIPVISCMGAGNKLDPTAFKVGDISETAVCPLAKVMRRECRKRGIEKLKVVYSIEKPVEISGEADLYEGTERRKSVPGSISFVPSVAGYILAGEVIRDIIKVKSTKFPLKN